MQQLETEPYYTSLFRCVAKSEQWTDETDVRQTCSPDKVWEAIYIIDGLMKNQSEIQPDTIHADTQGQNLPVFALSYLLGIKLMPRIRNWKDLKFYRPSKEIRYQHIDALFHDDVIDWDLIKTHWQDLLRVVLSIKAGRVLPSMLLRKLTSYSRKNGSIKRSVN